MRTVCRTIVPVLFIVAFAALPAVATAPDAPAVPAAPVVAAETLEAAVQDGCDADGLVSAEQRLFTPADEAAFATEESVDVAGCCRNQCRRDSQCDAYCGAPGAGVCVKANSCCYVCACLF